MVLFMGEKKLPVRVGAGLVLEPMQRAFLDVLAVDPGHVESALKESMVSSQRLARWLGDPKFRSAYFQLCAAYEEMFLPAVVGHLRERALGGEKDAAKWAKLWLDVMEKRAGREMSQPEKVSSSFDGVEFGLDAEEMEDLDI